MRWTIDPNLSAAAWKVWQLYRETHPWPQGYNPAWVKSLYGRISMYPEQEKVLRHLEDFVGGHFTDSDAADCCRVAFDKCENCDMRLKHHVPSMQCLFAPTKFMPVVPMFSDDINLYK